MIHADEPPLPVKIATPPFSALFSSSGLEVYTLFPLSDVWYKNNSSVCVGERL